MSNVYLIVPVRSADVRAERIALDYVDRMEAEGHSVHFPPRDVNQDCSTGRTICEAHRKAMIESDEVHVIWDIESKGSHFDLGMAYALGKPIVPADRIQDDPAGKSYWKAVIHGMD